MSAPGHRFGVRISVIPDPKETGLPVECCGMDTGTRFAAIVAIGAVSGMQDVLVCENCHVGALID